MTKPEEKLTGLRQRIDAIDETIARALEERTGIIAEVAALKAEHWPKACHIRPGREGQMHRAIQKRFAGTNVPVITALSIWRQLIGGSTHLESPLIATVIDHDHRFLAREYFGLQASVTLAQNLGDALERIKNNSSNLLILPSPDISDWWKNARMIQEAGLAIFASLPLVEGTLPAGVRPAVALAQLKPEPSGDDISYYVNAGQLEKFDGFIEGRDGVFLGSHPRPISLSSGASHD